MSRVRRTHIINAPLEQVWTALNDIAHTPQWVVGLERSEMATTGPYGRGSAYVDHNRLGPFPQRTLWRVTEFVPLVCQVHESESRILPTTMTLGLSMVPDGTRLEMTVQYRFLPQLGALGRLLERRLMNRMLGQVLAQNMANLNRLLTAPAPRVTGTHAAAQA